jgi:serralysin
MPSPRDAVYEVLAKEVAYVFDKPLLNVLANGFLAETGYKIDQQFTDPTTGFQALGLTSLTPDKPPVLMVRGADELIDDAANSDPRGIGTNQFLANRAAIATWLAKFNDSPLKPDLIGHSLGGSVTQLIAAEFVGQYGSVTTFNSPGVSNAIAAQFQQKEGNAQTVTHYIVNGDLVSLGGENYIPGTVILQSYSDGGVIDPIFALNKHNEFAPGRRLLSTPPPGYTQTTIGIQDLSSGSFSMSQETDFQEFIAAYRATPDNVADRLTSRSSVEALRVSPGFSFLNLVLGARSAVDLSADNVLVGNEQNNTAEGRAGKDTIRGNGGDDQLKGGSDDDRLFGGEGNDVLIGGTGNDRLVGVNVRGIDPGIGERDRLQGNGGSDLFVLGDGKTAYYDDGDANTVGRGDFALIEDFRRGDRIQLHGQAEDYQLRSISRGTGVYLDTGARPELIGIVQTQVKLSLEGDAFRFV